MVKFIVLLAALLMLGDCSRMVSGSPVLTPADVDVAAIRPGVWRSQADDCAAPSERDLPGNCGSVYFGDAALGDPGYVLAGGDVKVLQITARPYQFEGVRVLNTDDQGRAVRIRRWPLGCRKALRAQPSDAPYVVQDSFTTCRPVGHRGLLEAAAAEEPDRRSKDAVVLFWVRDRPRDNELLGRGALSAPPAPPKSQSTIDE